MYLTHAQDIQIKMAQGAKPGEGGQLPPNKVYPWIAKVRHSTPGVGLISPPPHHDIYSIEDLKQLIFDLKRANTRARIQVKLVSQIGIGTVASGVAKAKADAILVSGHDGGTGASPLSSLKHAGTPWELGLAETQQTLRVNGLRDRVTVQVDGQLKTGRDVVIAALLGAEEFGFATAPLVVSGCVMMRVCHLDTCPVGVATQNPELRSRFTGKAEFVENFFIFLAEQVREYLAELGFRSLDEAIGHSELLDVNRAISHWKADGLDLTPILSTVETRSPLRRFTYQDHQLDEHFDSQVLDKCQPALVDAQRVVVEMAINNTQQAVGTIIGHEITKQFGVEGLAEDTITLKLTGSAGQSFGAFIPRGLKLCLFGDSNDYVGKGLSGGSIVVRPPKNSVFPAEANVIAGNVIGYGATSGYMFIRGIVGERFLVRNSGATAVVEGVGDHALEYMTGGTAVILGKTGRNLAAGMSGGVAYVHLLRADLLNGNALKDKELSLVTCDETDKEFLRQILQRHLNETDSAVASRILNNFDDEIQNFTKLVPTDFARVLKVQQQANNEGLSPDSPEVWSRILEVSANG
jgi:glutamate synthase (NADPH/NADH) large chain